MLFQNKFSDLVQPISLGEFFTKAVNPAQLWAWTLGRQIGEDKWQFLPWTNSRYTIYD